MSALYETIRAATEQGRLFATATVIRGAGVGDKILLWPDGSTEGALAQTIYAEVMERAGAALHAQQSERITLEAAGGTVEVFIDVQVPPRKLIIVGAVHTAIPLVTFASVLGYETIVVDARSAFATPERFPHADQLIRQWPADALAEFGINESTCIVLLTHDFKFDNPALAVALDSPARYIGALGSRKTHAKRVAALQEMGISDDQLARIHAPIGLNISARGPEEIAVSIVAEIVALQRQK